MPEPQAPASGTPAEGGQTPETPAAGTPAAAAPQTPEAGNDNATVTLTQAELDKMIQDRAIRETRSKFGDYDALKQKAEQFDQLEESQKTELQKAQDAATAAAKERDEAKAEAARERLAARIESEAARQGGDGELILAVLSQQADLEVDGVKDAVAKLLKDKPNLKVAQKSGRSGGEFGGGDNPTAKDTIAQLRAKGDKDSLREARALEIEIAMGAGS